MNATEPSQEKPGLIRGKYVLAGLLLTLAIVAWAWREVDHRVRQSLAIDTAPLLWDERATWPTPPVSHTTLEKPVSNYAPAPTQEKWRTVTLHISALEEQTIKRCAELAAGDHFTEQATGDELAAIVEQYPYPKMFYPRWLLAQWQSLHGEEAVAADNFRGAFADAPAVLIVPYVDPAGVAAADLSVGTIVIACDQADGKTIDQTLKLVYPGLNTDATGRVYLPLYHTMLRAADLPQPPGYQCHYSSYQWFEFPGRVAGLRPAVVTKIW
ncbi:MAG: hypothetical protein IT445_04815 [Phycisphaeraceae bacterium]|nr:hypothetical protein [Phycisphaeraceae bacterium]